MADINQILTQIKTAIFGKDVRQAIHDGVKLANDTASGIDGKASTALSNAASALTAANSAKTTAEGIAGIAQEARTTASTASAKANQALEVAQSARDTANSANNLASTAKDIADEARRKADGALEELPNKIDANFGGSTSYQKIVTYGPTPTGVSASPLVVTELPATAYLPAAGYTITGLSSSPRSNDSAVNKEYVDTRLDRKIESKWAGVLPYASTQLVMYDNEDGMIAGYVPNAKFGITVRNGGIGNYTFALGNCGLDPESDDELVNYGFMKSYMEHSRVMVFEYVPADRIFRDILNNDDQYSMDDIIDMCDYGLGNAAFPIIVYNNRVYRCEHLVRDTFSTDDSLIEGLWFMSLEQSGPIGYVYTMYISRSIEAPQLKTYQNGLTPV